MRFSKHLSTFPVFTGSDKIVGRYQSLACTSRLAEKEGRFEAFDLHRMQCPSYCAWILSWYRLRRSMQLRLRLIWGRWCIEREKRRKITAFLLSYLWKNPKLNLKKKKNSRSRLRSVCIRSGLACVSQKSRKLFGHGKWPVKLPKTFSCVSQNPRKFQASKNHVISPR